ncbi:MAG: hypothetical protein ABSC25_28015 [Roseiarcus sp.]
MTRPYPPPLLSIPTVVPFDLNPTDQARIARPLGLVRISPEIATVVAHAIACFNATQGGSRDTTTGTTLAALGKLSRPGRSYDAAIERLVDDRYGIDYTTHGRLQPLARAVLAGDQQAREALAETAQARAIELRSHPRVAPETEALRFFCGMLRVIFDAAASPTVERTWRNCGSFALEVLSVAAIEHADFDAHPERLKEYLGTDVTPE